MAASATSKLSVKQCMTPATLLAPSSFRILMVSSIIAARSSLPIREFSASDTGASTICTDIACGPLRESITENSSFVPGFTVGTPAGRAVAAK